MVPLREIVLERDMRSPLQSTRSLIGSQAPRRFLSVATLLLSDVLAAGLCVGVGARMTPAGQAGSFFLGVSVVLLVAIALGLYGRRWRRRSAVRLIAWPLIAVALLVAVLAVLSRDSDIAWLALSSLAAVALAVGLRFAYDAATLRVLGIDPDAERLLVVGTPEATQTLLDSLAAGRHEPAYTLGGTLPPDRFDDLADAVAALRPTTVVVTGANAAGLDVDLLLDVSREHHVRLLFSADDSADCFFLCLPGDKGPRFAVPSGYLRRRRYVVKRAADIVVALLAVVLLSPFLLAVALIIRLTSPGSAIYVSWRVGAAQRPFPCYKFRTMCADAELRQEGLESLNEADGCLFKIADDPRVTRVGRFLRRTSLDELPQLFNVLAGQMSLVGPRPLPLRDVGLLDDRGRSRHVVLPGMTGLWQVRGRSSLGADEMLDLDLEYIEAWSLRRDLSIVAGTVGAVLARRGAC